jgi:hypothetical protein
MKVRPPKGFDGNDLLRAYWMASRTQRMIDRYLSGAADDDEGLVSYSDYAKLQAKNAELEEKIQRLLGLVADAYEEGWYDCRNTTSVVGFEPDWRDSHTKKVLQEIGDE